MFKQVFTHLLGKASATATTENEVRVSTGGELAVGSSVAAGTTDSGNPTKIGGVARQTNPTAVSNGTRIDATFDDLGRQVVWPYQVRDLISTGFATLTRSQEATVISAVAGAYLDLMQITASNTSSVAVPVAIRNVLAGNTIDRIVIPIGGCVTRDYTIPYPASDTGNVLSATVDLADQSDSPVSVSMIAIRNV